MKIILPLYIHYTICAHVYFEKKTAIKLYWYLAKKVNSF